MIKPSLVGADSQHQNHMVSLFEIIILSLALIFCFIFQKEKRNRQQQRTAIKHSDTDGQTDKRTE